MEYTEVIGLLSEMILEDSRQPPLAQDESSCLLEECLRAYEYECQWKKNSTIRTNTIGNQIRSGWE